jgi:phosphoglycerate dehydrogenase-like enzyme
VERVALDDLLARSDTVVICCPLTGATHGMIGARELALLGPRGVLVNVARGAIVDEPALCASLAGGTIGGAGLDVFADEPHVPRALCEHPRVVLTPHIADYQSGTLEALTAAVVRELLLVGSTA